MSKIDPSGREQAPFEQGIRRRSLLKGGLLAAAAGAFWPSGLATARGQAAPGRSKVRNVIFCVSDGMSAGVLALAEQYSLLARKKGTNWVRLAGEPGTTSALMDTASRNSLVTDSAAASSAWSGGVRVDNGSLNVSPDGTLHEPIGVTFHKAGKKLGLVTTATITHATPAGFAVCQTSRSDEKDIAPKYLGLVDVALGGGKSFFDPTQRPDRTDLWQTAREKGYTVCLTKEEMLGAPAEGRLLGTFSNSHLPYVIDRPNSPGFRGKIPSLAEMTRVALQRLDTAPDGFLLQIEGARVDHAAHANDIAALMQEQLDFDDALGVALEFAGSRDDTLVIVTSDHGNSNPGLNGMGEAYSQSTPSFARVLDAKESTHAIQQWALGASTRPGGLSAEALADRIQTALGFKPTKEEAEALLNRIKEVPWKNWNHQLSNFATLLAQISGNHNGVGWTGNTHTADHTILHATGPGKENFHGFVRNDSIRGKILEVVGIEDSR